MLVCANALGCGSDRAIDDDALNAAGVDGASAGTGVIANVGGGVSGPLAGAPSMLAGAGSGASADSGASAGPNGSSGGGAAGVAADGGRSGASAGGVSGMSSAAGRGSAADGGGSGAGTAGSPARAGAGGSIALGNPTIWIAGDSTVMTYAAGNTDGTNMVSIEGWGQELGAFFDDHVKISNQAIGGRSVAFFMWSVTRDASGNYQCVDNQGTPSFEVDATGKHIDTSQWGKIEQGIKAGDFLLIQFGTNDETHDCPRYVSLPDFETDLGMMADSAIAKGATPIFVTPMGHRSFSGTMVTNTLLPYANAMKDEASKKMLEVEDLNLRSEEYYMSVGNSYLATNIFDGGTTHFIQAGAIEMAKLIAGEVRRNDGPLAAYLKP